MEQIKYGEKNKRGKKGNKRDSNRISFAWADKKTGEEKGLFRALGYTPNDSDQWRNKKQKVKKIIKLTLKSLQDKGEIKGFEEYREDGTKNPASPVKGYVIFTKKKA